MGQYPLLTKVLPSPHVALASAILSHLVLSLVFKIRLCSFLIGMGVLLDALGL